MTSTGSDMRQVNALRIGAIVLVFLSGANIVAVAKSYDGPPLDLLAGDIRTMPYTARIRVSGVHIDPEPHDTRAGGPGYVSFRIEADVLETIKGRKVPHIEYRETREAPAIGPTVGSDLLVSLQESAGGALFVPDNGYVFPATRAVLARARALRRHGNRPNESHPPSGRRKDQVSGVPDSKSP